MTRSKSFIFLFLFFSLFIFTKASASTYYVSNTGLDTNNGTAESTPWQTISKVNSSSFLPGDNILFKKGDTWRGTLEVPSSGNAGAYIVFSSYGIGDKPKILGSTEVTSWTNDSGNIWYSNNTLSDPYSVLYWHGNIYFKEISGSISWGKVKVANKSALISEYQWEWESNRIYIYSPTDPNTRYSGVEVSQLNYCISTSDKEYVTIDGLEIAYSGSDGIGGEVYPYQAKSGLIVRNCLIHHIGIKSSARGYGIYFTRSNTLIQNNEIHDCGRRSISLMVDNGGSPAATSNVVIEKNNLYDSFHTIGVDIINLSPGIFNNIVIRYNYIHLTDITTSLDGVESFHSNSIFIAVQDDGLGAGIISNVYIYYNIIKNTSDKALQFEDVSSCYIYNNTIYGVHPNWTVPYLAYIEIQNVQMNGTFLIKNNIIYNNVNTAVNATYGDVFIFNTGKTNATLDHNLYYATDPASRLITWEDVAYSTSQWATYKTASGQDSHSIQSDPLFLSASDYHLTTNSPAINAGVDVGLTTDFLGHQIVGLPDIGAYESNYGTPDTIAPTVDTFTIPSTSTSLIISFTAPVATDTVGVTGYLLTETSTEPSPSSGSWTGSSPTTYTFSSQGSKTLYAWAKDAASNVSLSVSGSVIITLPPVTATTFTLTGPSSGSINSASTNFIITPNNTYTGTVTITPSGTGSTGLSAIIKTFSSSAVAQTFTITPTVVGSITLTPTNNGGLTNPANRTYTSNAIVPGTPTGVTATASNTSATVSFTAPASNGGSVITGYIVTSIPAGGTDTNTGSTSLSHSITGLTNGTSYTFTVKAINSIGQSVASSASILVIPIVPIDNTPSSGGGSSGGGGGGSSSNTSPTISVPSTLSDKAKSKDIKPDGIINIIDFNIIMANWNKTYQTTSSLTKGDMTGDGKIDIKDINQLMVYWGVGYTM